jgi:ubiquinone/menaquinone biosynthesis C-methylase UbiE
MKKSRIQTFYDDKYKAYVHPEASTLLEKAHRFLKHYELHRNDAALQLLEVGNRFLDVGAGSGALIWRAKEMGFSELYGIDVSKNVIDKCRQYLKNHSVKAKLSRQNIDAGTSFKKNYFDAITMIAVFEHIVDPHFVLSEVHRILKRNGQFIVEVPNVAFIPRRLSFLMGKLPKTSDEAVYTDGHLQFFTQHSLVNLLEQHGFRVVYKGSSGIWHKIRNLWPSLLGANIIIKCIKK